MSQLETDLAIGPRAIEAYSRLSYTMWHALAEFIDNSTQSRTNYESIIDDILASEGTTLTVDIVHDRVNKEIRIRDNSIGMTLDDLVDALKVAFRTKDSKGRSRYGMGMKTAACWIGRKWRVVTCEWAKGEEWTADVDVQAVVEGAKVPLTKRDVGTDEHYTEVIISGLHRNIQARTEETIRSYLGSMYRFDLKDGRLRLTYNGEAIPFPDEYEWDTDPHGTPMRRDLPEFTVNGRLVRGWIGVLRRGGRRFGGFSLFQNRRQIQGFPHAWKPRSIFGGVDDEGANNLVAQRLMGVLELEGFDVSHTKDAIQFRDDEEEALEKFLVDETKEYREFAQKRRGARGQPWAREKVRELLESMKSEFTSGEMKDALNTAVLPPLETILANNKQQLASLTEGDEVTALEVLPDLRVVLDLQERSEYDPHLTIVAGAAAGTIHVIVNALHPYYSSLESADAIDECMRQYIYDAIAEYRVVKAQGRTNPDSVRRLKNDLLRAKVVQIENTAAAARQEAEDALASSGTS